MRYVKNKLVAAAFKEAGPSGDELAGRDQRRSMGHIISGAKLTLGRRAAPKRSAHETALVDHVGFNLFASIAAAWGRLRQIDRRLNLGRWSRPATKGNGAAPVEA